MLKLPVCPYCNAIYRYKDVKKITHIKKCECHHCKRKFMVSYLKGRAVILIVTAVLLIALNLIMLNFLNGVTILGCLIIAAVFISLAVILFPFTVRFKEIDGERIEENINHDNRKIKRSQKNKIRKNKKNR